MEEEDRLTVVEFLNSEVNHTAKGIQCYVISECDKNGLNLSPKRGSLLEVDGENNAKRRLDSCSSERESSVSSPDIAGSMTDSPDLIVNFAMDKLKLSDECSSPIAGLTEEEISLRVKTLIEYYLSDENLQRDMFLLKHINKHREGFVSLKLLSKYKKVKRFIKNVDFLQNALKDSSVLEVHLDGTKVRRKVPVPEEIDIVEPFKIILAFDIPDSQSSIDRLAVIFGKYGDITSLQVHKPSGRSLPEVQLLSKEKPELLKSISALIEYETVSSARNALTAIEHEKEGPIKAIEYHRKPVKRVTYDNESSYFSASDLDEPFSPFAKSRCSSSSLIFSSPSPCPSPYSSYRRMKSGGGSSVHGTLSPSPLHLNASAPIFCPGAKTYRPMKSNKSLYTECNPSSTPSSPWVRRRRLGTPIPFYGSCPNSPMASPLMKRRSDAIIRSPKGPDGSAGFQKNRSNFGDVALV